MATPAPMLILVNPTAGRGRGLATANAVADVLRGRGATVTLDHTLGPGDAGRATQRAAAEPNNRPGCIVACGGDGTVQEVASALATMGRSSGDDGPTMGLAPAGRCNDFAHALGIATDPKAIAAILMDGSTRPIDLGRVNGRFFCTVATVGIDAEVSSYVDTMGGPLRGTLAYLYGALRVLKRYQAPSVRITGDFGVIERPVFLASSANTAWYGGSIEIAPGASPADGHLDLCVIDKVSRLRALTLVAAVLRHKHLAQPEVRLLRVTRITIESDKPLDIWADGERVATTPATIEVIPAAVNIRLAREGMA